MGKCHMSQCHRTDITQIKSHNNHRKVVHRPCSNYISSIQEMYEDSIEFSLSSANKGVVSFIPAQELAILTLELNSILPGTIYLEPCLFLFSSLIHP